MEELVVDRGAEAEARRVAILGLGLMGCSLGLALNRSGAALQVTGYDPDPAVLQEARRLGAIGAAAASPAEAVREADLVVLAAPVTAFPSLFHELGPGLSPRAVVSDLGSVKRSVLAAASALPRPSRFIGGHPLAGRERSGPAAADADLFAGRSWAVVPPPGAAVEAVERVLWLVRSVGAVPLVLDAEEHDRIVAAISHLPQLAAYALATAVLESAGDGATEVDKARRLAGTGFRDTTRLAASNPGLWRDLALANRDHLLAGMERLRAQLDRLAEALAAGDGSRLESLFASAREARLRLGEASPSDPARKG